VREQRLLVFEERRVQGRKRKENPKW